MHIGTVDKRYLLPVMFYADISVSEYMNSSVTAVGSILISAQALFRESYSQKAEVAKISYYDTTKTFFVFFLQG